MNPALLQKIRDMSEEEIYASIYKDSLTGASNRRAFEEVSCNAVTYTAVAIVDLDSLKYLNDEYGHRTGDKHLCDLASALERMFGVDYVFRIAGDEFAILSHYKLGLESGLIVLQGKIPGFSSGIGTTLDEADIALRKNKIARKKCGQRAGRGKCPPWLKSEINK
jgi:GGDEF domain-containing protein